MIGCTPFVILSRTSATKSHKKLHLNLYAPGTWAPVWPSVQQLHLFRLIRGIKPLKPSATRCHSKSHKSPHVGTWLKSLPPLIMKETYRVIWKERERVKREAREEWVVEYFLKQSQRITGKLIKLEQSRINLRQTKWPTVVVWAMQKVCMRSGCIGFRQQ